MQKARTIGFDAAAGWALAAMLAVAMVAAAAGAQPPAPCVRAAADQGSDCRGCIPCAVVREIADPFTGQRWLLLRGGLHPGGPDALVAEGSVPPSGWVEGAVARTHPVIRAGDRLTVEQSSANFDLRLEGIALAPAAKGAPLRVRLVVSGKIVAAVALGPGRVVKSSDKEFWP